jgi:hypothetical protein
VRLAVALVALALAGVVAALVVGVSRTRDPAPDRVASCAQDGGAQRVRGALNLQAARADIDAGATRVVRRYDVGGDPAVLVRGPRFRLLVVEGRKSPALGGDVARRVYARAAEYAYVGIEIDPVRGVLDGCAKLQR